ncbi:hypothetical protein KUL17_34520 [Alteromonas sp. KUL17]|nr:hypothetical protein KUL17_34520 [Alteromonas sp. KUL17]
MSSGSGELPSITTASVPLGKLTWFKGDGLSCPLFIDAELQAVSVKPATIIFIKDFTGAPTSVFSTPNSGMYQKSNCDCK